MIVKKSIVVVAVSPDVYLTVPKMYNAEGMPNRQICLNIITCFSANGRKALELRNNQRLELELVGKQK